MKDRNVNSYNLQYAQQILSSLAPANRANALPKPQAHAFVRLTPRNNGHTARPPADGPATAAPAKAAEAVAAPPQKFGDWDDCIAWCMEATRAEAAFVVDSQGFIIATRGRIPGHGFECTGAELIYSMDQLERIDPDAGKLLWIDLDFNKRRLVGFVTPEEDASYFIVGLVAPDASYNSSKHVISKHIIESLADMN